MRAVPGFVPARLSAIAPVVLAAALFAIPADEARAHNDNSATLHAETYPLHEAAKAGDLNSVNHFITVHMADVNAKSNYGHTPLYWAAYRGHASAVSILIAAGANVNAKNNGGDTPLHRAARQDYASVASILIAAGADVNAKSGGSYGDTPLHRAAQQGNASVASILIAAGAEVNAKTNSFGNTPLHEATPYGHVSVVSVLIAAGAEVNAKDDDDKTPLHTAAYHGRTSVVSVLIAAGGHWGEACAGAATVNPAGASIPCLCESPNVGTVDNCAESCGELTPPMHYDATAGECVPLATCNYEEVRNEETNICECHAPNVRYHGYNCYAPSANNCLGTSPRSFYSPTLSACAPYDECVAAGDCALSADICARTSPPQFYSPTLSACTSYDECMASEDCALSAHVCRQGFSPGQFYDSETGECVSFAECDDTAELNQSTNQCECTESSSQRYLRPSGVCESRCNNAEIAVRKGEHRYGYYTRDHYECECAATKNGIETTTVNGVCEFLYPCHESAIRKVDNSGCECPSRTFAHGDPSGGSHSHIPDTAICHADHAPIVHNLNGWLDSIRADNPTLILHFISDHDESPNQLTHAIQHSAHRAITILINRGANLNLADSDGDTPLHLAARRSDTPENAALVSFLLDKGADPNIFNNSRWRPLDLADGRDGYPRRRKIMSALIAGGANWSDECVGGKVPNEFTPPKCKCPARLSIDNNGLCECPAHSHSQVNGLCLPKDSAQVEGEIAKMQVELARLRAALISLNARISLSAEMPREMVEDIAEQARETAAEIDWRRANFVALGRRAEAGEAPPPVALSDTAAECRMRGGEVRIDSGSGTRICLGLDRSGTFCLVDSGDAFPCRGLFKHVRRCNDVYHRPALNAFICGERCGADETARGRGCE